MTAPKTIAAWHDYMRRQDPALLADLLADDVVFESPVVHTPQAGKALTTVYLGAAAKVLGTADFRYLGEYYSADGAVLEFTCTIDGITINGIDMIHWREDGRIVRFKVMIRPLKAINLLHRLMAERLPAKA